MRILHTSDWHLGATLQDIRRDEHFQKFLDFLPILLKEQKIDCLIVAGDIFDTANPPISARKQYYDFLAHLGKTGCKDVVIISGNHDSPSLLDAPKELLEAFSVHVVTKTNPDDEIIPLGQAVIIAIPYLRESDIGTWVEGSSLQEQQASFQKNVQAHCLALSRKAQERHPSLSQIFVSHAFIGGSKIYQGEDEYHYVGNLGALPLSVFPTDAAYVALGHIHRPQKMNDTGTIRYSGSPLPISFSEDDQQKEVEIITIDKGKISIQSLPLPPFCDIRQIKGNKETLEEKLTAMLEEHKPIWLSIVYTGSVRIPSLKEHFDEMAKGGQVQILRTYDEGLYQELTRNQDYKTDLSTLTPQRVFDMFLEKRHIAEDEKTTLLAHYGEILKELGL